MSEQNKTQAAVTGGGSALSRYQDVIVGQRGLGALLYFEFCVWLSRTPGALGLLLRKTFWPRLFGACGAGTTFGRNVKLRHPHRIFLGDRVVVSDDCVLDARNASTDRVLEIGNDVMLADNVTLSCKNGTARIGNNVGFGTQTVLHAVNNCHAELGNDLIIGPACYLAAGGNYDIDSTTQPMAKQGLRPEDSGITLAGDNWLGATVSVLPGVTMGQGSVAAAGAVVARDVEQMGVVGGVPAKLIRYRGKSGSVEA
jgi:acetyltransferase-like isoleucine patch superfamily enzyme